jgi:EpsI family protein
VIDILPSGSTQRIALEVVEACSGIRSLMTLVTLAVVLVYFTRSGPMLSAAPFGTLLRNRDFHRAALLMLSAAPVAVVANAARVATTGYLTYLMGTRATEGTLHEALGVSAYAVSFLLLLGINVVLKKLLAPKGDSAEALVTEFTSPAGTTMGFAASSMRFGSLLALLVFAAASVNWLSMRGELSVPRQPLSSLPSTLGKWTQRGDEKRFDAQTESVLRATDYTMRDYRAGGRTANVYVGYYESQRGGATYHSPKNCLPGSGWVMKEPEIIEISTPSGRKFEANRFIVESGNYRAVMIYWYQGRGRVETSEYRDKLNTVLDSFLKQRTDGAMVRVMTTLGSDSEASHAAAIDVSANLADSLNSLIPD